MLQVGKPKGNVRKLLALVGIAGAGIVGSLVGPAIPEVMGDIPRPGKSVRVRRGPHTGPGTAKPIRQRHGASCLTHVEWEAKYGGRPPYGQRPWKRFGRT